VKRVIAVGSVLTLVLVAGAARAGAQQSPSRQSAAPSDTPAIDDTMEAGEAEAEVPRRRLVNFNEYEGPIGSIRVGFGFLTDYATYHQDEASKEQFPDLSPEWKVRDSRILFHGSFKTKRPISWSAGVMYDWAAEKWVMRQTHVMIAVPEIWGHIAVGRTKEGFSMNKVMIGYGGWTMERQPINDATLPILADGVKWLGYVPKARILWNLGFYGDAISEGETFSTYENQLSGRFAWVPILSTDGGNLLHIGVSHRYGKANNGKIRLKARPGVWAAPFFVDTAEFAASGSKLTSIETYWRPHSVTVGGEYFFQRTDAPESGDPFFHGGEMFMTWLITGETRTYNTRGGYFNQVSPSRPVFSGGPGAWEIVTHGTFVDLDDKAITGGRFWRLTPMLNWYLSDHVRLEVAYGYSSLNRFGTVGKAQFFQTRIQLQL
jgi:phosphate-selective porin OprO/OprP